MRAAFPAGARENATVDLLLGGVQRLAHLTKGLDVLHCSENAGPCDDVGGVLRSVAKLAGTLSGSRVSYELDLQGKLPVLNVSPTDLTTILLHLLKNSIYAIDGKGKITLKARAADDGVFLSVIDSGRGIAVDKLTRIFEPFFSTKGSQVRGMEFTFSGTGLGLYSVYTLVSELGGEVKVGRTDLNGTEIEVFLPGVPRPCSVGI